MVLNRNNELTKWYKKKVSEIEATGWRRHGAKVGDKVRFHCPLSYEDDELWEEIQGKERPITMQIEHGSIGEIIQLGRGDSVYVRIECTVWYYDDNSNEVSFTDEFELQGDILDSDEISHLASYEWAFELVDKPHKHTDESKQLSLFDKSE